MDEDKMKESPTGAIDMETDEYLEYLKTLGEALRDLGVFANGIAEKSKHLGDETMWVMHSMDVVQNEASFARYRLNSLAESLRNSMKARRMR